MVDILSSMKDLFKYIPFFRTIITLVIAFILLTFLINLIKRNLLKKVRSKKQNSNIEIFTKVLKYFMVIILIIIGFSSYSGSWVGLGIGAGLFSAALGWALQRPITGIAAWIMVIVKRPFEIGDRIIIGDIKGDVVDISLTHIHLGEIGGTVASEESSGRVILIPNSMLFEQKIINYTLESEFVLDEAVTLVTYESSLDKAKEICFNAVVKSLAQEELKDKQETPRVRVSQSDSGIHIKVRYNIRVSKRIETLSNIHNEIISTISKTPNVSIAYPHMHIVKDDNKPSHS